MNNPTKTAVLAAAVLVWAGCGSNYPFLSATTESQARSLREYCAGSKITSAVVARADSLLTAGTALLKNGDAAKAYPLLDRAVISYRLALSQLEMEQSRRELAQLKQALADSEERLADYRRILDEVKAVRNP